MPLTESRPGKGGPRGTTLGVLNEHPLLPGDMHPAATFSYDFGVDQRLWGNNAGKARSGGVEFTSELDLLDTLVASVNYTYTDSEILATRHPIPREPAHRWNLGLTWEPLRRLSLFTQVHVVSEQFEATAERDSDKGLSGVSI